MGLRERAGTTPGTQPRPIAPRRVVLERSILVELYVTRGLSSEAIAQQLGCSSHKVRSDLRYHGIELRSPWVANPGLAELDPDSLRHLYLDLGLTIQQIAERHNCSARAVANRLIDYGIQARPRGVAPLQGEDPTLPADLLRDLYQDQRLSARAIAERLGRSQDVVRSRLARYGIAWTPDGVPGPDADKLRQMYLIERASVGEIACQLAISQSRVRAELNRHDIHRPRTHRTRLPPLDPTRLQELYVEAHLSLDRVAEELSCSRDRVIKGLRSAGIVIRPRNPEPASGGRLTLSRELLEELYVAQSQSLQAVAARLGTSPSRIREGLVGFGIPVRPSGGRPVRAFDIDAATLGDLYVGELLSVEEIAARYATTANQVRLRLRAFSIRRPIPLPPRSPVVAAPPQEVLEDLYVQQGATSEQIAKQFHTSSPRVRAWLRDAGIQVKERASRASRQDIDAEVLRRLYLDHELTMAEIADRLDVTLIVVRRSLHAHAIPVRPGGARPRREDDADRLLRILDELYADADVGAMLQRHGVPRRPQAGPIALRFPEPVALNRQLLIDAYQGVGLAAGHIELLTGQPADQILDALHQMGIQVRRGGSSPWRRRLAGHG